MNHGRVFLPRRILLGAFAGPDGMLAAASQLARRWPGRVETHSPYPVHGIERALGLGRPRIPALVLMGGLLGAVAGYFLVYYTNAYDYPINVGNRPPHSPPVHIPIAFELAVLFGAGFAFFGLFMLAGLPRPYHPVFEAEAFRAASVDTFFVALELAPGEEADGAEQALREAGAGEVHLVQERER